MKIKSIFKSIYSEIRVGAIKALTFSTLGLLLACGGSHRPSVNESHDHDSQFFTDDFSTATVDTTRWKVFFRTEAGEAYQENGLFVMKDNSDISAYIGCMTDPFQPRDFTTSIKLKVGKKNKGNIHFEFDNVYPVDHPLHRSFFVYYTNIQGDTTKWASLCYHTDTHTFPQHDVSNILMADGSELNRFVNLRLSYHAASRTGKAWVDDVLVGETILDWDLNDGMSINFSTYNEPGPQGITEAYFKDFITNIPVNNIGKTL
jgi:hypothetical protein